MKKPVRKIAVTLGALGLGLALVQPATAQVGDSKPDPRSLAQGVTDNDNQSVTPVGFPHSTNNQRCAGMRAQSWEYTACMENLLSQAQISRYTAIASGPVAAPGQGGAPGQGTARAGSVSPGTASTGAGAAPAKPAPSAAPAAAE